MSLQLNGNGTIAGLAAGGLPDGSVTQPDLAAGIGGNGPLISVYRTGNQTILNATWTKVGFNTEDTDTAGCFDSTTNFRFTPNVAGWYQVNASIDVGNNITAALLAVYLNGLQKRLGSGTNGLGPTSEFYPSVATLVYCNGTTDYLEVWAYISSGTPTIYAGAAFSHFTAFLARTA